VDEEKTCSFFLHFLALQDELQVKHAMFNDFTRVLSKHLTFFSFAIPCEFPRIPGIPVLLLSGAHVTNVHGM
jgi:hypothetical protein